MERIELTDGFVRLRAIGPRDFEHYWEAAKESFREVSLWMGFPWPANAPKEDIQKWYSSMIDESEHGMSYTFSILDASDRSYLGHCFFSGITDSKRANLGYWVRTSQTKRGVATAAVRLLAAFGLKQIGLLRIEIVVATPNVASQRVAEKSGAMLEGVLRNRLVIEGRAYDAMMYSVIPSDTIRLLGPTVATPK
jgi:ribosomal-protein-serine acetyltransferase